MSFADTLKSILGNYVIPGVQTVAGALGPAISQASDPALFQQQQENARQNAQLTQQLNLHNQDRSSLSLDQQLNFGRQLSQDQVAAQNHKDEMNRNLFDMLQKGATLTSNTDPDAIQYNGKYLSVPDSKQYTIPAKSEMGKLLGLTDDIPVSSDKYLQYGLQFAEKGVQDQKKAATQDVINKAAASMHPEIDQRFNPDYYKQLYGQVDPSADNWQKSFHDELNAAAAKDKLAGTTSQLDSFANRLRTYKSPWEQMMEKKQERAMIDGPAAQARADNLEQRSYQFHAGELDRLSKPVEDALTRFSRLSDTVSQKTPQADSLVAPELLSVMAGGSGSGLRMNEAEISRIIGGRTNLEDLKAALNKWQLDPSKGLQITDPQRDQIRSLVATVGTRLQQKNSALIDARSALAGSRDISEHRQIFDRTNRKLSTIDGGNVNSQLGLGDEPDLIVVNGKVVPNPKKAGK